MERALYILTVMAIGGTFIACSSGMIAFNKYLMQDGRFPYPLHLVAMHAGSGSLFSAMLFLVKPSLFKAMTSDENRVKVSFHFFMTRIFPIGLLFVLYNVLSNQAYKYSSVAFLQMMKEVNVALVYAMSVIAAVETFSLMKARILVCVMCATCLTVRGELHFSLLGFIIQFSSQLFEATRITLQSCLLTQGRKLDPFSYNLLVLPTSFVLLALIASVNEVAHVLPAPSVNDFFQWRRVLACNALLAFSLNLVFALFMSRTSAVATVLVGIVKDVTIVLCSAIGFHEQISRIQALGFALQLTAILVWSLIKLHPDSFRDSVGRGVYRIVMGDEKLPITESTNGSYKSCARK